MLEGSTYLTDTQKGSKGPNLADDDDNDFPFHIIFLSIYKIIHPMHENRKQADKLDLQSNHHWKLMSSEM